MALQDKYAELINAANARGVSNLQIREQGNVLYIDGDATSAQVKDELWDIYDRLDPDYRSADLVLNINAPAPAEGEGAAAGTYTVKSGDSLSKIGKRHGVNWQDIYELNKDLIGGNPDLIQPGQELKLPQQ